VIACWRLRVFGRKDITNNWVSALLRLLDREGIFSALNFDVGVYDPANQCDCVKSDVPFSVSGLRVDFKNPNSIITPDAFEPGGADHS